MVNTWLFMEAMDPHKGNKTKSQVFQRVRTTGRQ